MTIRSSAAGEGAAEMATTNLSLGGAHVISRRFLPLMTRVEVALLLPPEDGPGTRPRPVRAEAVVVRVAPSEHSPASERYEMALFFSRMDAPDRTALARYLSSQSERK